MTALNRILRATFDVLLAPVAEVSPLVSLAVISLVTGVFMLVVFKATSDQQRIEQVKRQIQARLFEIRLFNDDLRAIFRAQFSILALNLRYLGLSLVPLLWMIVPLVLLIAHLQFFYGYSGLLPGEPALLSATFKAEAVEGRRGFRPDVRLETPDGLAVTAAPVWAPALRRLTWRVEPSATGVLDVRIVSADGTWTKEVRAGEGVFRRSPYRPPASLLEQIVYPAEDPVPGDAPLESVSLSYPETEVPFFGLRLHWIIVFFVLSIVFALVLRKPMKVTF